jgi:hypothetical protein
MVRIGFALAVILVSMLALTTLATAQVPPLSVGVFLDSAGTQAAGNMQSFVVFDFYVVGFGLSGLPTGYEWELHAPTTFTILSVTFTGPNPSNEGTATNVIVGMGGCVDPGSGAFSFARYNGGFFAPGSGSEPGLTFCLGPAEPSSFVPAGPGYLECDGTPFPLEIVDTGPACPAIDCLVLNPDCPVPTDSSSFGAIKVRY